MPLHFLNKKSDILYLRFFFKKRIFLHTFIDIKQFLFK
ncbi:hypothetical protein FEM08_05100 [Flavobacterium gilvum]|nr:hypothetical protein FEM08_05100 [Flavobacterium gilvum]